MAKRVTLESRFPEIAAELRPRAGAAVKKVAELVATDAENRVHFGPPPVHIRTTIDVVRVEAGAYAVIVTARDPHMVEYPYVVEYGDATNPAYPFLVPALEAHREEAATMVAEALRLL